MFLSWLEICIMSMTNLVQTTETLLVLCNLEDCVSPSFDGQGKSDKI